MDFTVSETQQEIAGLAARVLRGARPVPVAAPPGTGTGRDGGYDAAENVHRTERVPTIRRGSE